MHNCDNCVAHQVQDRMYVCASCMCTKHQAAYLYISTNVTQVDKYVQHTIKNISHAQAK